MEEQSVKEKLELREMELISLLEITQAINNNLPAESLFKIFEFTLRANLRMEKLALFVFDDKWSCKVNFGTSFSCQNQKLHPHFQLILF